MHCKLKRTQKTVAAFKSSNTARKLDKPCASNCLEPGERKAKIRHKWHDKSDRKRNKGGQHKNGETPPVRAYPTLPPSLVSHNGTPKSALSSPVSRTAKQSGIGTPPEGPIRESGKHLRYIRKVPTAYTMGDPSRKWARGNPTPSERAKGRHKLKSPGNTPPIRPVREKLT